jgi:hypothetical protein
MSSDYFLFPTVKFLLEGYTLQSLEEVRGVMMLEPKEITEKGPQECFL